ncbi:sulfate permease [Acetobacter indonesiensis NRIC 0313]|uniref:Sodium-independent anion transporter n=1 Tax=Acetobacter indonesiensis TaxID=104101 RepID=A0A6N3T6V2_9PROT|nr:SulP family inorganic anion transporter [Acetobacter indonesiensis]GAN62457.1 transporter of sulfate [Acetobacter indonesiensis]GBQ54115.1 sulfate permease [Acetobacter indonesiensis NRIC 0313]GEN03267.1 sodium-independent anion transporter [Acetobacter indonesiensis]
MTVSSYIKEWTDAPVKNVLAGMVGTFALIPEVIAFSYAAGVAPEVGLYASFVISIAIAITGGRPGMISGAAGSVALVAADLVHGHGFQYLLLATLLAGAIQVLFGLFKLQNMMRFVSREVATGFVNALAILIFSAQIPQMVHVSWQTYALIALGLAIVYLLPRITTLIPSPLICIVVLTGISIAYPMPVHVVSDLGPLPTGLPSFTLPHLPLTLETFKIVLPYAFAMAMVGVLESLMTAGVVDEMTDTHSNKRMECTGLGVSNILVGLFGGMAGCGMIGQTVGNLRYGGTGRLSTFTAGAFLLLLLVVLHNFVAQVPVAALVAIMIMVSISTFSWSSLRDLVRHPRLSSTVMIVTVVVVVLTHDLAAGVACGVILSGLFFSFQVMQLLQITSSLSTDGQTRTYHVRGQLFFASTTILTDAIDFQDAAPHVVLDLSAARLWDISAADALEKLVSRLQARSKTVHITHTDERAARLLNALGHETLLDDTQPA